MIIWSYDHFVVIIAVGIHILTRCTPLVVWPVCSSCTLCYRPDLDMWKVHVWIPKRFAREIVHSIHWLHRNRSLLAIVGNGGSNWVTFPECVPTWNPIDSEVTVTQWYVQWCKGSCPLGEIEFIFLAKSSYFLCNQLYFLMRHSSVVHKISKLYSCTWWKCFQNIRIRFVS